MKRNEKVELEKILHKMNYVVNESARYKEIMNNSDFDTYPNDLEEADEDPTKDPSLPPQIDPAAAPAMTAPPAATDPATENLPPPPDPSTLNLPPPGEAGGRAPRRVPQS